MTQPTDPRGSAGAERSSPLGGARTNQDTILLSDAADPEALAADAVLANNSRQNATNASNLNLSSAALAALGQRYDILDAAGHGSMGNVYKARDRETGETVALKLLKPEIASDQQMMDRFKNELLFARKITHKNVCRVHEFNRLGGIAYTSMEFVEGESLRSVLNRFGGLPLRKGIDLAQQLCSGLKEAHAQGIVHRDLKPENVMIDARGNVKIMDFGIARSMESLTRMTGAMVGTPAYMAPEQVAGKPVDYRTDIYSLGLMLYEVFTGTPAFTADNAVAVAMKQLRESAVPPHEIDPSIPVPIERAILKALEKEPEKRFQSVAELEKVFVSRAVAGAPVAGGSTTAGRSTQEALAVQPTIPIASAVPSARPEVRSKSSRGKTTALWVSLMLFALAAAGAGRWARNARLADKLPAAPAPVAPGLPELAFAQPSDSTGESSAASQSSQPEAKHQNAPAPTPLPEEGAAAPPSDATPAATTASAAAPVTATGANAAKPSAKPTGDGNANSTPADVQQRADAAFKENQSATTAQPQTPANAAGAPAQPLGSVLSGTGPSYIWVARYDREDRAQDTSRKIQGFGLTSVVLPRHGPDGAQFYIVLTGPFPPARLPSVIDWLKAQGFPNVREIKSPGAGQAGRRGAKANPQGNADGVSE